MAKGINAVDYADSEKKFFPKHWDEQTVSLVRFMLLEAYNAGTTAGISLGLNRSVGQLKEVIKTMEHHIELAHPIESRELDK
jgi:hypothetical protein